MSDKKIRAIVNNLLDGMGAISKSETIVGEPQQAGDATVIPVHKVKVAFGAGSGSAGAHGSKLGGDYTAHGAGGAVEIDPIAAIAVDRDGHAHMLMVEGDSPSNTWANLIKEVPELVTKVTHALGDRVTNELQNRGVQKAELEEGASPQQLEAATEEKVGKK